MDGAGDILDLPRSPELSSIPGRFGECILGEWRVSEAQEFWAMQLYGRLRRIVRLAGSTPLPMGRGAETVHDSFDP